jgi:hypothetical protein
MIRGLRVNSSVLVLCVLFAIGCSSTGTVTGKLSYRGQTLKGGTVVFFPEGGGGVFRSPIAEDGTYTVTNVPPGLAKISVETKSIKPIPIPRGVKITPPPEATKEASGNPELVTSMFNFQATAHRYVRIPDKYSDPEKSGLTCTVSSGKQEYDIDLK